MSGGADPVAPILAFPGRGRTVHLKEYPFEGAPIIGEGEVPWAKVFDACESVGGTEWYIVEYEAEGPFSALDAVAKCLENLRGMGK
jgi:sugar phosphate isomerase/epimerase